VKSYDTETAAEKIRPLVGAETSVLCLQNGVDNEEKIERILGVGRVLYGVVHILSTISAPGSSPRPLARVGSSSASGTSPLRSRGSGTRRAQSAKINAEASPQIMWICGEVRVHLRPRRGHALTRLGIGDILACPETALFFREIMDEIVAVGRASGVALPADASERSWPSPDAAARMRSSLAHDLEQGNRLEVEALMGAVVRYEPRLACRPRSLRHLRVSASASPEGAATREGQRADRLHPVHDRVGGRGRARPVQGATIARIEVLRMHCVECGGHIQDGLSRPGR